MVAKKIMLTIYYSQDKYKNPDLNEKAGREQ